MAAKQKDFIPQPFEAIGTEPAALLFVDLKKDWIAVVNADAVKYELKAASGVVRISFASDATVGSDQPRTPHSAVP